MKKFIIPILALIALNTSLSAQITREQADKIVWEHLQNEVTLPYFLYVYNYAPSAEGMIITTYNEETVKVKYACWAYYLNENPGVSEPSQHRYLFVKENDGNLLEIITTNDLDADLTGWEPVLGLKAIKRESISIYPNPTTGKLGITNYELGITNIEVFDVYGRNVRANLRVCLNTEAEATINISHLPAGIYFVKIKTETGIQTQKIIKL